MAKTAKKAAKKAAAKKPVKPATKRAAVKTPARAPAPVKKAAAAPAPVVVDKERFTLYGMLGSGPTYTVGPHAVAQQGAILLHSHQSARSPAQAAGLLVKNRYGQVPALRDGQTYYVQSAAILEHLAETLHKFEGKTEFEKNRIREWLFWQWDKLSVPVFRLRARARGIRQFGDEVRILYDTEARAALAVLENELGKNEWVAGKRATIADVGVYGVLRYAGEANIDLSAYPNVSLWKKRFEALPGFGTPEQILPMESRLL